MATQTITHNVTIYSEEWIVTTIVDGDTFTQTAKRASDGSRLFDTYVREPMVLDFNASDSTFTMEEAIAYYTQEAPHAIFSHAGY